MSGHSKWSTIKRKKGAVDAKRGKIFTKLIREIATAARIGRRGPRLESAPAARRRQGPRANMPKDNIERAIKKGTGAGEPTPTRRSSTRATARAGRRCYIEVLTDNKNRTVGEVRHVLTKLRRQSRGERLRRAISSRRRGCISFDREGIDVDALLEAALEAGAEDVVEGADTIDVVTAPGDFEPVKRTLTERGFSRCSAEISHGAQHDGELEGKDAETMLKLADALEDLDDVQNVYANFDISEEEMARIAV